MKFTARFRWRSAKEVAEVTWEDGRLSGDPVLTRLIESTARGLEGMPIGFPTGGQTVTDHLSDPFSALYIMRFRLPEPIEFLDAGGEVPTLPPVPDGAIP
ncbi:hypothetical protein SAMN05421543_101472 [Alicyclobacillus macrosporangiidus]|jgi:hypothetical protein|uniref:Uncharacterized protein n=1 Tax=Alicyclobacillus macrosporangiidus TaxID=392015 RepID=A0A1I7FVB5_9BACL|nr:hypothetical protein SAMN05421543_101472 [Alicyclobacillus macrosporangiidus]